MFDINYLNHSFIFHRRHIEQEYLCTKCNIFCYRDTDLPDYCGKYFYWDKHTKYHQILKLTCKEMIIKNLIE